MAVHYKKALDAMQAGDRLMFTHADPRRESDKSFYSLIPSGKTVHPLAVRKMREKDQLSPIADGLFGADLSQTFELRK